jgi:hypothetical protein
MVGWPVLHRVKESRFVGRADSKRMGLVVCEALLSLLTFEASSHPYVMRSSDDEGGGLLADGQTRCS